MQSHNLIPSYRREARRRRRRCEAWVVGVSAYGAILTAVFVGLLCAWGVDSGTLARRREATATRTRAVQTRIEALQSDLADARRTLQANETLGGHPDWSLLLMLVARRMNDDVVLRTCSLAPQQPQQDGTSGGPVNDAAPSGKPAADGWRLEMHGFGKNVAPVSQFALAIEQTGLFDHVQLLKTVRQPFLAGEASRFQIVCDLGTETEDGP